ncbi:MAG: hypothetical protein HQK51_01265 [Oligoflexia bacterium]|nr:hypothetical protein [Oligoflexia bacterium]
MLRSTIFSIFLHLFFLVLAISYLSIEKTKLVEKVHPKNKILISLKKVNTNKHDVIKENKKTVSKTNKYNKTNKIIKTSKTIIVSDLRWKRSISDEVDTIAYKENTNEKEKKWINQFRIGKFGDSLSGKLGSSNDREVGGPQDEGHLLAIFQNISQYLNYPDVLYKNGITGKVNVRIVFDKNGIYQEKLTKFDSTNEFIKVQVARTLRKSVGVKSIFKDNFNKNLQRDFFVVDTTFYFAVTANTNEHSHDEIFDSKLHFYRVKIGEVSAATTGQKIAYRTLRTLQILRNPLLLLEHRPNWLKTERELVREIYDLGTLREFTKDVVWE